MALGLLSDLLIAKDFGTLICIKPSSLLGVLDSGERFVTKIICIQIICNHYCVPCKIGQVMPVVFGSAKCRFVSGDNTVLALILGRPQNFWLREDLKPPVIYCWLNIDDLPDVPLNDSLQKFTLVNCALWMRSCQSSFKWALSYFINRSFKNWTISGI